MMYQRAMTMSLRMGSDGRGAERAALLQEADRGAHDSAERAVDGEEEQ